MLNRHAANRLEQALARRADLVAEHERLVAAARAAVDQAIVDMANQPSSGLAAHLPGTDPAEVRRLAKTYAVTTKQVPALMGRDCGSTNCRLSLDKQSCATKSVDAGGALDHRLARGELASLNLGEHLRRLVRTAWEIGGRRALKWYRFRQRAHTLGSRGHCLTKSPYCSTTLSALRQARLDYQGRRAGHVADELAIGHWAYSGTGHRSEGDAWLADANYKNRRLNRRTRWEEE
jgi:hypothetical protein